ncbi:MAG: DUF1345 domain-containing protein [Pseudomonadota bacterium]
MPQHFAETTGPTRLVYGAVAGGLTAVLPVPLAVPAHGLLAWGVASLTFVGLSWWLALASDAQRTRQRAQAQDEPGVVLFLVMLVTVLASVAAIAAMLQQVKEMQGGERTLHITLSMLALAGSWMLIHTLFAFRYAHRYYHEELQDEPDGPGLVFPGQRDPDYFDFLYHAFVVGMTSQVSDVQVTSREMRHLTLVHSVLAFAFNMLVLALSINVVAGAM